MSAPASQRTKKVAGSWIGCCVLPRRAHSRQTVAPDIPDGSHMTQSSSRNVLKHKGLKVAPIPAGKPSVATHTSKASNAGIPKRSNTVSMQDLDVNSANKFDDAVEGNDRGKSAAVSLPAPSYSGAPVRSRLIANIGSIKNSGVVSTRTSKKDMASSQSAQITRNVGAAHFTVSNYKSKDLSASTSKRGVTDCIRAETGMFYDQLEPVGTRCELCKLDLAFTPQSCVSSSHAYVLPPTAVLHCGHCYHVGCLQDVLGPEEPACISCSSS